MIATPEKRILVVDDDDLIRETCQNILASAGYFVETAADGVDALNKIKSCPYDLILSDLNMPRLDGYQLYLCVKKDFPFLTGRFLLMTGNPPAGEEGEAILLQIHQRILKKPFHPKELLDRVRGLTAVPIEWRKEERYPWNADCHIALAADFPLLIAVIQNISSQGMKIKHSGLPVLKIGDLVSVNIPQKRVERKAQVRWSDQSEGFSLSGLELMEPLPVPSILAAPSSPMETH
ncbi:MAG: response regulator [Nitrospirae bacterium]|nr:response regulator [Bacteroidota bacterium]MBI3595166.1 response regulator [Nitrospirota bacterium]